MKANTKGNNRKKLIPAAGALMISAAMLGTSTFAWFTMSREVEVTNISMVATTPEDIQISLGKIGKTSETEETSGKGVSLAANTGYLYGTASDGKAAAPANDWDWSDTADFAHYYQIGKLIPASSDSGANIFFTPDANGVGKTVKADAKYYQANVATVNADAGLDLTTVENGTGNAKATLHAVANASDTWASTGTDGATAGVGGYSKSTKWNKTGDDGYYVDIPVWLRTSSTDETKLTVKGYVAPRTTTQKSNSDNEALYKAVRVALLDVTQDLSGQAITSTGLIDLRDGLTGMTAGNAGTLSDNPFGGSTILDWYTTTNNNGAVNSLSGTTATYTAAPNTYDETAGFVTLNPGTGGEYGKATKFVVRVWLEGNDPDCWNDTAGQDWYINLKFGRVGELDNANITGARVNDGDNLTNTDSTAKYGDAAQQGGGNGNGNGNGNG